MPMPGAHGSRKMLKAIWNWGCSYELPGGCWEIDPGLPGEQPVREMAQR